MSRPVPPRPPGSGPLPPPVWPTVEQALAARRLAELGLCEAGR